MGSQQDWHERLHIPDQFIPKKCEVKKTKKCTYIKNESKHYAMQYSPIQVAEHKLELAMEKRKGQERVSTNAISVTTGGGRCKGKNEGGGRVQEEREEKEHRGQLGRKVKRVSVGAAVRAVDWVIERDQWSEARHEVVKHLSGYLTAWAL